MPRGIGRPGAACGGLGLRPRGLGGLGQPGAALGVPLGVAWAPGVGRLVAACVGGMVPEVGRPVAACGGLWRPVAACGALWRRNGARGTLIKRMPRRDGTASQRSIFSRLQALITTEIMRCAARMLLRCLPWAAYLEGPDAVGEEHAEQPASICSLARSHRVLGEFLFCRVQSVIISIGQIYRGHRCQWPPFWCPPGRVLGSVCRVKSVIVSIGQTYRGHRCLPLPF